MSSQRMIHWTSAWTMFSRQYSPKIILAKERFFQDEHFFHTFTYYDPVNRISLNGRTKIITLELSKLAAIVEKPAHDMSLPELWAVYIAYLTDRNKRGKINEIVALEEGIAMASSVLMTVSRDEEERARIMRDEKIELDYQSYMVYEKREARREGKLEGKLERDKELLENARNALVKGYPIETIHDITGLDTETIRNLSAV